MANYREFLDSQLLQEVETFIKTHWDETIRSSPQDDGTLIGLPHPYTIPSRKGAFQELYYWDTYFTSIGLIRSGRIELARDNALNLLALVDRYGFVPNGNRTFYLTRSQPPYLAPLVRAVAEATGDLDFARHALPLLRREYDFWMTRRITPTGLSHYGHHADRAYLLGDFYDEIAPRAWLPKDREEALPRLAHTLGECESGGDLNPRFENRCLDYCPVDLNCLLYLYELFFADFGDVSADWTQVAERRAALIRELCWDEERGGFYDYDFVNQRRGPILTAWLHPLWTGVATAEQARIIEAKSLPQLEYPFGLAACAPGGPRSRPFQWDYPNSWPCLHLIAYEGFHRYGATETAVRLAQKYLATVARSYQATGDLWEKYNAEDGTTKTVTESGYGMGAFREGGETVTTEGKHDTLPAMMGWTAGVFLDAQVFCRHHAPKVG